LKGIRFFNRGAGIINIRLRRITVTIWAVTAAIFVWHGGRLYDSGLIQKPSADLPQV